MSEISMEDLVSAVVDDLTTTAAHDRKQLHIHPLPLTKGDPTLIRQVVVNLLSNAIKFTRHKEAPVIEIGARVDQTSNIYFLKDNGAGFDMQQADKLFGVFQRLHSEREFEGTGLGLAIVQRIIQRHGGRVWAEAKVGEGATFYFALPR